MISQPPIRIVHPKLEVWSRQITVRPFVVHHRIARNAEHAEAIVRRFSENAAGPKSQVQSQKS